MFYKNNLSSLALKSFLSSALKFQMPYYLMCRLFTLIIHDIPNFMTSLITSSFISQKRFSAYCHSMVSCDQRNQAALSKYFNFELLLPLKPQFPLILCLHAGSYKCLCDGLHLIAYLAYINLLFAFTPP